MPTPQDIAALDAIASRYRGLICDVWGVIHNGETAFPDAIAALKAARARGLVVVLVTNSPRRADAVVEQLQAMGVPPSAWDRIVTSGDVTRELIAEGPRRVFHIGPDRDMAIYDDLDVEISEEWEADQVVCTGLFEDETETPADYADLLARLRARDLPFVCANPDIVVERGDRLIWCAGALARDYTQLGGRTLVAGKPHRPIYEAAMKAFADAGHETLARKEVLAIGDGVLTDVKGAADFGLDVLYISGGIHAGDYGEAHSPDPQKLAGFLSHHGYAPVAFMPRLR
jgi:HAD superfamily hydrolase (TIGR01459 family)